ncbi:MAG: fibronectin type III domain-containing protein [bacterium]|nr:fibronectin type III domain-containing protein [bacterium]
MPRRVVSRGALAFGVALGLLMVSGSAGAQSGETAQPAAPTNVRVVAESRGSVTVAWDAPEPQDGRPSPGGYRVLYRLAASEPGADPSPPSFWHFRSFGAGARQGRVTGLMNGRWYEVTVASTGGDWAEETILARPGAGPPGERPPGRPVEAVIDDASLGSLTVAWEPPADDGGSVVTGYEVWYVVDDDRWAEDVPWVMSGGTLDAGVREHTISGLVDYRSYVVVVAAVNEAGRGLLSRDLWGVAGRDALKPPAAPTSVRLVGEGDGSVTVAWDPPEAAEGQARPASYTVYYWLAAVEPGSNPSVPAGELIAVGFGADVREGTVSGLTNGVWYELRVQSRLGHWARERVFARPGTGLPDERLPGAPTAFRVVEEGSGSVTVGWEPPAEDGGSAVTGYEVWYRHGEASTGGGSWVQSGEALGPDTREHAISGLVDLEEYRVTVAAVNDIGRGPFVGDLRALAGRADLDPPAAPANVRLAGEGDGSVTVAWDAPEPENGRPLPKGYRVLYRRASSEPGSVPDRSGWYASPTFGADSRSGTVSGLRDGVWYELRVQARHGEWSEEVLLVRPGAGPDDAPLPGAPADLTVLAEGSGSVTVGWDPPAGDGGSAVTGYEVWYRHDEATAGEGSWVRSGEALGPDARRHVVSGLVDYRAYEVTVAAVNEVGRGLFALAWATANRDDLDPLRLIADHRFARFYTQGTDTWEVWVCDVADGRRRIDLTRTVAMLNREVSPYFRWLSGGRYRLAFVEGGTVKAGAGKSSEWAVDYECEELAAGESVSKADGALIVHDKEGLISTGGSGAHTGTYVDGVWQLHRGTFADTGRAVHLTAGAVLATSAYCGNCPYPSHIGLDTVAHEIGHALGWPHSYGGNRPQLNEASRERGFEIDEYDNPMDRISGGPVEPQLGKHGLEAGTVAVNRYAAGWIDIEDVAVHLEPYGSYLLAPIGRSGTQMLVLPVGEPGHFISLGARVARGYDAGIPAEGVEVYRVDQRASACREGTETDPPDRLRCTGLGRRIQPVPAAENSGRPVIELTDHVYGPGEGLTVEGFRVEVTERVEGRFRVWVGNPYRGTFADDERNVHERSIDKLADLGISAGCDPELKLYCPDEPITRAQMAVFLIRAMGESAGRRSGSSRFSDVASDAWYRPYVERLAELEITVGFGDGTFRPDDPVTRAQMAVFLTRAFSGLTPVENPSGVFDDVASDASYASAVEGVLAARVTAGCGKTPGRNYCPGRPVRRDQIASFLVRALQQP